jgi:hypothetical protein
MTDVVEPLMVELATLVERTQRRKPNHREALVARSRRHDLVEIQHRS